MTHMQREQYADQLAEAWSISPAMARRTIRATTQQGIRTWGTVNTEHRYPSGDRPLRYNRIPHKMYHDTFFSTTKSSKGNTCSHIFATDFAWSRNYPLVSKEDAHFAMDDLFHQYGVPETLVSDDAKELTLGVFAKKARQAGCHLSLTDHYSPWQNRAESEIRKVKRLARRWMVESNSPRKLWDYCTQLASVVRSHTAHDMFQLQGEVPETILRGTTADISHVCEFAWYQWVIYNEPNPETSKFSESQERLGRYLGPTQPGIGSVMSYYVLNEKGVPLRRTTVRALTPEEQESESKTAIKKAFDIIIRKKLGSGMLGERQQQQEIPPPPQKPKA